MVTIGMRVSPIVYGFQRSISQPVTAMVCSSCYFPSPLEESCWKEEKQHGIHLPDSKRSPKRKDGTGCPIQLTLIVDIHGWQQRMTARIRQNRQPNQKIPALSSAVRL